MELGREADNGHSLARLDPMNQVGGKADTCGGLSTDTAFLVGDGAEGLFPFWKQPLHESAPNYLIFGLWQPLRLYTFV